MGHCATPESEWKKKYWKEAKNNFKIWDQPSRLQKESKWPKTPDHHDLPARAYTSTFTHLFFITRNYFFRDERERVWDSLFIYFLYTLTDIYFFVYTKFNNIFLYRTITHTSLQKTHFTHFTLFYFRYDVFCYFRDVWLFFTQINFFFYSDAIFLYKTLTWS